MIEERMNMLKIWVISSILLVSIMAACQPIETEPVETQPVFSPSLEATVTPIPIPGAKPKLAATLKGVIWGFEVSPDGSKIAFATSKGVEVFDYKNLTNLRILDSGDNQFSLAWSPDGKKLAAGAGISLVNATDGTGGEAVLRVWETSTWSKVLDTNFGGDMVNERILDIAWKPDGSALALGTDMKGVMVVDALSGEALSQQTGYAGSVREVDWSPDGSRLVSTGDMAYSLRRWKVSSGESVRLFDQRVSNPWHVIWMQDGKRIISGHVQGMVCFWTVATNKCDGLIRAHRTAVFSMATSSEGTKLATGGGVIRIWDTTNGKLLKSFGEDEKTIYNQLAWTAGNSQLVSYQTNPDDPEVTIVRFWDIENGIPLTEVRGGQR
jgi:WD40 repeat protein